MSVEHRGREKSYWDAPEAEVHLCLVARGIASKHCWHCRKKLTGEDLRIARLRAVPCFERKNRDALRGHDVKWTCGYEPPPGSPAPLERGICQSCQRADWVRSCGGLMDCRDSSGRYAYQRRLAAGKRAEEPPTKPPVVEQAPAPPEPDFIEVEQDKPRPAPPRNPYRSRHHLLSQLVAVTALVGVGTVMDPPPPARRPHRNDDDGGDSR